MIAGNRMRDILHDHRLTSPRLRHDQTTLPFAKRRHQLDHSAGVIPFLTIGDVFVDFQIEVLFRIKRCQVIEIDAMAYTIRLIEINLIHLQQGEISFAILWRPNLSFHGISGAQAKPAYLARTHINVVRAWQIIRFGRT